MSGHNQVGCSQCCVFFSIGNFFFMNKLKTSRMNSVECTGENNYNNDNE